MLKYSFCLHMMKFSFLFLHLYFLFKNNITLCLSFFFYAQLLKITLNSIDIETFEWGLLMIFLKNNKNYMDRLKAVIYLVKWISVFELFHLK